MLSARAGIVAVRSGRGGEGALALASRLVSAVRSGRIESASPDLALAHIARDITVRKNAEAGLIEAREAIARLIEEIPPESTGAAKGGER